MRRHKSVYLEYSSYEITISEDAFQEIVKLVQANAVCRRCNELYSAENPNVAGNLCLSCFLQTDRHGLAFVKKAPPELAPVYHSSYAPYIGETYLFLDPRGYVHLTRSGPGEKEEASEHPESTLSYWGFPIPREASKNGQTIALKGYWMIYGDVRTDEVIMLRSQDILFLAKRKGQAIQFNKRKALHRQMLAEAQAELEATRTSDGIYLIDGEEHYSIHESDLYRVIARRVNAACTLE